MPTAEVHFFDLDSNFDRGRDWYFGQFVQAEPADVIGEKSANYLDVVRDDGTRRPIPERISALLPDVRLVFLLRDPVDRLVSAVTQQMFKRRLPADATLDDILFSRHRDFAKRWNLLGGGLYGQNLREFYKYFQADQILVKLLEDDILKRPEATFQDVCRHVGVRKMAPRPPRPKPANAGVRSRLALRANARLPRLGALWHGVDRLLPGLSRVGCDDRLRARLAEFYRQDREILVGLLGRDLEAWR